MKPNYEDWPPVTLGLEHFMSKEKTMDVYDIKKHGVTQGLLSMFMRCRTETTYWMQGLESLRTSQGLQFGTIAHIVLEKIYSNPLKHEPSRGQIYTAISQAQALYVLERGGRLSAEEHELMEVTLALLEAVLPSYFEFNKKDFKKVKWAELEKRFVCDSPVPGVQMTGRRDGAYWIGKELWLRENKTKARIEEDVLADTLSFDFQNSFYIYSLVKDYKVWPKGVLYDIIRRPGERQKQGESLNQYKARVEERVRKEPQYYFLRYEVSIPKSEHERFVQELANIIKEFKDWTEGKLPTYRNTSSCIQRFGPCRYLPLCSNGEFPLYRKRKDLFPELVR